MSANIPNWFVQQYNTNIMQLVQQKTSRLRTATTSGNYVGQSASPVDQIGAVEMRDVTSRYAPMGRVDADIQRRWVAPYDADLPQLIDTFDKLKLLTDPQSAYVTNAVSAANRKFDDRVILAFFAAAMTGVTGASSTAFDTTNQTVGVSTGGTTSGLNVAKLEAGRAILWTNECDLDGDEIWCLIGARENQALLNEIQIISLDYNEKPVYDDKGRVLRWRGINFAHSERSSFTTTQTDDLAGQSRAIPMWMKSGMHLGIWNDIETAIDQRADLQGRPWQAYTKLSANATRLEEKKVVRVWAR